MGRRERDVQLVLTPAQARAVNAALAFMEAAEWEEEDIRPAVFERARQRVWEAMDRAGVKP